MSSPEATDATTDAAPAAAAPATMAAADATASAPEGADRKRSAEPPAAAAAADAAAPAAKRACSGGGGAGGRVIDRAVELGLQPGDRIEVQWQLGDDNDEGEEEQEPEPGSDGAAAAAAEEKEDDDCDDADSDRVRFRWWPATLVEHDGQTLPVEGEDGVALAVRVLEYDPYPEGGFPDRTRERVVFLGPGSLADLASEERMAYRREGETYEDDEQPVVLMNGPQMEGFVNAVMASLLEKHSDRFRQLPAAQQAALAERMRRGKERFLDILQEKGAGLVTAAKVQELLAQAVSE